MDTLQNPSITTGVVSRLASARRATRRFKPDALPAGCLEELLDIACRAPSGYNAQPTRYIVVDDPAVKQRLHPACLSQRQILEAPAIVVVAGDRSVAQQYESIISEDLHLGAIDESYAAYCRKMVRLALGRGPLGLGLLWKSLLPLARFFRPIPLLPAVHRDYWLAKQAMLPAMTFMLAATERGLATCPMEGFDEARVRRALRLPRRLHIVVIVAVGFADGDPKPRRSRRPLDEVVHRNGWG
jgi:nitroreductase